MTLRPFLEHLDTLNEPDWVTLSIIADYCEEHGKPMRAEALRWLVENRRWVVKRLPGEDRSHMFDWWLSGTIGRWPSTHNKIHREVGMVPHVIYIRLMENNHGAFGIYTKPSLAFADFIHAYARARRAGWVPKGVTT